MIRNNFLARRIRHICPEGNQVLEYTDYRRECRKAHEQEEQRPPELTARHSVEYVGERYENQSGALTGVNPISKARREDNQTCHQRNRRIQNRNADCLAHQGAAAVDKAAENRNRTHADAQCEESLTHRGKKHLRNAVFHQLGKIGIEIEPQSFLAPCQKEGAHRKHNHQHQQRNHHHLRDFFYAVLQPLAHNQHTADDNGNHKRNIQRRAGKGAVEGCADFIRVHPYKAACRHLEEIINHPTGNRGVKHHQDVVTCHCRKFEPMPFRSLRLQHIHGKGNTALTGTPNGKLQCQNGNAQNEQKYEINQHKGSTAVFSCDVREFPHIPQTDGAACGNGQKAQTGAEFLSVFHKNLL